MFSGRCCHQTLLGLVEKQYREIRHAHDRMRSLSMAYKPAA